MHDATTVEQLWSFDGYYAARAHHLAAAELITIGSNTANMAYLAMQAYKMPLPTSIFGWLAGWLVASLSINQLQTTPAEQPDQ